MKRDDIKPLIIEALHSNNGSAAIYKISEFIWENYHHKISADKKMLYTWQYEVRWAAMKLRDEGVIELGKIKKGIWSLKT